VRTVVHVTHEAVYKIGGIGAVLHGLLTSKSYNEYAGRSILVGPFFEIEGPRHQRLGREGRVIYSSVDGLIGGPYVQAFKKIQRQFGVGIIYGKRRFQPEGGGVEGQAEVLLVDVREANQEVLNRFKARLWEAFGIESDRYETAWEFEQYMRIAEPAIAALRAIGATNATQPTIILAHEFMGMPTALAAMLDAPKEFYTAFYAHEVAPVRKIVEEHPGHDLVFYNALSRAAEQGLSLEDVFGSQRDFFKYALVACSRHCDNILAVGDYVAKELRFLGEGFERTHIDAAYNGIPAFPIDLAEHRESKARLQEYCQNLLEFRPDYIFSHVSRMVVSKAFWRDLLVLEHLEKHFRQSGRTAVYFALATELPRRRPEDIYHMESAYGWPVAHREGLPDLSNGEASFYSGVQIFNAKARNIKVVFVNQFGWDRASCGLRMPEEMTFFDLRKGADVEFGQSIYEPFGIAQLEPLSFGGLCVVSKICGCAGFVKGIAGGRATDNVLIVDYTDLSEQAKRLSLQDILRIDRNERRKIERRLAARVAEQIFHHLPQNLRQRERLIASGFELASQMGWDEVARRYIIPGMERAYRKRRAWHVA